jgi:hypothetical protein
MLNFFSLQRTKTQVSNNIEIMIHRKNFLKILHSTKIPIHQSVHPMETTGSNTTYTQPDVLEKNFRNDGCNTIEKIKQ